MALGRDCLMLELAMREPVQMGLLVSACEKCHENRLERMLIAHANITRSCALRCTGCMETGRLGINRHDFRIETVDGLRRLKKTRYSCCKNPLGHSSQCATSETLAQRNQSEAQEAARSHCTALAHLPQIPLTLKIAEALSWTFVLSTLLCS